MLYDLAVVATRENGGDSRRLVEVPKPVAELRDRSLGELLEVLVYEVFAGRLPFHDAGLAQVRELLAIYGVAPAASAPGGAANEQGQEVRQRAHHLAAAESLK